MSLNNSDQLEFRGKTIKECEEFIAAVNKHARSQGKFRDDQWIADFVAVCLVGDALIWWSLLDEETQGSWRLLRQAMISRFRPLFYGKSGAEAEEFVQEIRQRALNLGKSNDPHWTAEFASTCFMGAALRWYTLLDASVQDNWKLLQRAIFAQYRHESEEDCTTAIAPTPASAAAPPVPSVPVERRYRGRIRVCKRGDPAMYYISKIPAYNGRLEETSKIADALEVEHGLVPTSEALQALAIPDNQISGFNQLGMKWASQAEMLETSTLLKPDPTELNLDLVMQSSALSIWNQESRPLPRIMKDRFWQRLGKYRRQQMTMERSQSLRSANQESLCSPLDT